MPDMNRSSNPARSVAGRLAGVMVIAVASTSSAQAQGALADYERAEQFVAGNIAKLMSRLTLTPHWLSPTDSQFWYVAEPDVGSSAPRQFMLADPRRNSVRPAFDHARLAVALSKANGARYSEAALPFGSLDDLQPGASVSVTVESHAWRCNLHNYVCQRADRSLARNPAEAVSPDRRWVLWRKGDDLMVRDRRSGETRALTNDGEPDNSYAGEAGFTTITAKLMEKSPPPVVMFSPDSSKVFTYRLDTRAVRKLQVTQTKAGAAPIVHSYSHPIPGDAQIAQAQMMVFDLASGKRLNLDRGPVPIAGAYESLIEEQMRWNATSTRVYYVESGRGYKTTALHCADATTGADAVVVAEHSDTYVAPVPTFMTVAEGREVVWSSERDGWNHLYLVGAHGAVKRRLTSGEWVVYDVLRVDEKSRWVYFTGGGREAGRDPYYAHLYRVSLDGGAPQLLTPEDADHSVAMAPSGEFFVDTYSRMDLPPVSVLRRIDGKQVRELQRADISQLAKTGWRMPERFHVKSGDGVTDLYGVIYRPSNFDPNKKYPIIDSIYPGPQIIATPKSFSPAGRKRSQELPLAELGFIVINMDGKGTPLRSRAFREAAYGKLGYIGDMEDHLVAIRDLASRDPSMDVDRVGIFGHSGGGYAAARAMLMFPDFYKVAVASNGNHDARAYWAGWGERYQGYPVDVESYDAQSNAPLAGNLKGKLLLVAGALDDNVSPQHTLALADALISANKDFDMLILPNRDHGLANLGDGKATYDGLDPYFVRRRWDYFVRYLMGVEPPREFRIRANAS